MLQQSAATSAEPTPRRLGQSQVAIVRHDSCRSSVCAATIAHPNKLAKMAWARWGLALASAVAACLAFSVLFVSALQAAPEQGNKNISNSRSLLYTQTELSVNAEAVATHRVKWNARTISGIVLSVVVSLTSSIDRECGSALYLVLFAVLCNLPLRNAMAMTAFTIACGSLAPAIAAMSEARSTERGILALVDYPGILILLPTMFWGLSMGVIINMWFPSWLLALLWVVFMATSNAELMWSIHKVLSIRSEVRRHGKEFLQLQQTAAAPESATGTSDMTADVAPKEDIALSINESADPQRSAQILCKLAALRDRAEQVEGMALLYPAFYIPSAKEILDRRNITLADDSLAALKSSLSAKLVMEAEEARMLQLMQENSSRTSRFTWRWGPWWKLQNHFEFALVLKVVVLHLVTEAVRHRTTKPCSNRFWFMVFGMTGLVTAFLIFTVTAYSRRRLWRGPHWMDALAVATQLKKQERAEAAASTGDTAVDLADAAAAAPAEAAPTADQAVANNNAAAAASTTVGHRATNSEPVGCWGRFKKRLPWSWVPAHEAINNISACNSTNQYKQWVIPRLLTAVAGAQAIGVLACALGLPAGPSMAYLLLMLGLKPHVVAGSSRFLVLCFCFGVFVAYIIAGNLHRQLAAAFALLNLGLAPLGMLLFRRLQLQAHVLLLISLVMGMLGMVCVLVWELVPLIAHMAGSSWRLPSGMNHTGVMASSVGTGNEFDIRRFCLGSHY